jgi:hypothetical protein
VGRPGDDTPSRQGVPRGGETWAIVPINKIIARWGTHLYLCNPHAIKRERRTGKVFQRHAVLKECKKERRCANIDGLNRDESCCSARSVMKG